MKMNLWDYVDLDGNENEDNSNSLANNDGNGTAVTGTALHGMSEL